MSTSAVSRRTSVVAGLSAGVAAVATVVLAPAAAVAGPAAVTARFATYNIHAGAGAGSDNAYDLARTAAAIRALDADVVGLEERRGAR